MKENKTFYASRILACVFMTALGCGMASAQVSSKASFNSKKPIQAFDNTTYCTAYVSDGKLFTLRDIQISYYTKISNLAFNPTGSSVAVLRPEDEIRIFSFRKKDKCLFKLKDKRKEARKAVAVAMCYSANARHFIASNSLGEIIIYDTQEYLPQAYIQGEAPATALAMSSNNYFISAAHGNTIDIWNFQTRKLRTTLQLKDAVTGINFSEDASLLAVTVADKSLVVFDTKTWKEKYTFTNLNGQLTAPSFHPDGKYLAVVKDNRNIVILNLKNNSVEQELTQEATGTVGARFFMDRQSSEVFLLSNQANSMVFWDANKLNPFYGKLISSEVDAKMNEWVKMMQGESMEDYAIRVNDETRLKQQQLFEQEVATRMAGDRISMENPFIGDYDAASGKLNIGFDKMASISFDVPEGDLDSFKDSKNLSFDNAVYVLNDADEFEIAYVEVRNETTNKVYIYDNIGRTKLTALEDDANFVPLEIIQQANREEEALQAIKETVVEENKQEKLITDNTQINVKTEVIPDVDADGNKILNYKVGYQYEVINKDFSAKEDFPSGGYDIEKSNAAMSLMKIIKNAFEGDFAGYLAEGKQVKVIITGSADASPIRGRIAYRGQYGSFVDEPYYKNGNLDNITVTPETGITQNEQLALLRAAGVTNYIKNNITTLQNTKNEYEYHVEVAKERGGEYRRINVEFVIVDAFKVQ